MQMIADWQYPGSSITGLLRRPTGRLLTSVAIAPCCRLVCKTVMTTEYARFEKVVDYYRTKLSPMPKADGKKPEPFRCHRAFRGLQR